MALRWRGPVEEGLFWPAVQPHAELFCCVPETGLLIQKEDIETGVGHRYESGRTFDIGAWFSSVCLLALTFLDALDALTSRIR